MSRIVYLISILFHVFWLLAGGSALAADPPKGATDDFDRWIPSIGLTASYTGQVHKGTVNSAQEIVTFPFGFPLEVDIPIDDRVSANDQKNATNIQVGGIFELQTPQLLPYTWSPRVFIGGELLHVSSQTRPIAREGNPGALHPEDAIGDPDLAILGQGSLTTSDTDNLLYTANVGIAIPIQLGDWRVKIKPSARYLNQKILFSGAVLDAMRGGILGDQEPTRIVEIRGSDSLDVHAVGPGLEIEIDAARIGSIGASVFISGGAYKVLSQRRVSFSTRVRDSLDTGNFRGDWTATIDPWIYRAGVGFRVRWLGFGSGWLARGN